MDKGKGTVDYKLNSIDRAASNVRVALRRDGHLAPTEGNDLKNIRRKVREIRRLLGIVRAEQRGARRARR